MEGSESNKSNDSNSKDGTPESASEEGRIKFLDKLDNFHQKYSRYALVIYFLILTSAFVIFMLFATRNNIDPTIVTIMGVVYGFISTVVSAMISRVDIRHEANKTITETWLPMAEGAARRLYTISNATERLRLKQNYICDYLQPLLSRVSDEDAMVISQLVAVQCESRADQIQGVRTSS